MNKAVAMKTRLPPRLTLDAYVDFVEASMREADPALVTRQKRLEKRIEQPFSLAASTVSRRPRK